MITIKVGRPGKNYDSMGIHYTGVLQVLNVTSVLYNKLICNVQYEANPNNPMRVPSICAFKSTFYEVHIRFAS